MIMIIIIIIIIINTHIITIIIIIIIIIIISISIIIIIISGDLRRLRSGPECAAWAPAGARELLLNDEISVCVSFF